jgi:hypothetical protein
VKLRDSAELHCTMGRKAVEMSAVELDCREKRIMDHHVAAVAAKRWLLRGVLGLVQGRQDALDGDILVRPDQPT